jgi:hypothetical protein
VEEQDPHAAAIVTTCTLDSVLRWGLVLALVASALTGCGSHESATNGGRLTDLTSVGQLQRDFDAHEGRPRLLLLLSPT